MVTVRQRLGALPGAGLATAGVAAPAPQPFRVGGMQPGAATGSDVEYHGGQVPIPGAAILLSESRLRSMFCAAASHR